MKIIAVNDYTHKERLQVVHIEIVWYSGMAFFVVMGIGFIFMTSKAQSMYEADEDYG